MARQHSGQQGQQERLGGAAALPSKRCVGHQPRLSLHRQGVLAHRTLQRLHQACGWSGSLCCG